MNAIAFDTHKAVKTLKAAGVEEAQAEAFVETFGGALNDNVATKDDLALLKGDLDSKIDGLGKDLRSEMRDLRNEIRELEQRGSARIESLEHRMTIKLGTLIVAGVGFLVLLDRLFPVVSP